MARLNQCLSTFSGSGFSQGVILQILAQAPPSITSSVMEFTEAEIQAAARTIKQVMSPTKGRILKGPVKSKTKTQILKKPAAAARSSKSKAPCTPQKRGPATNSSKDDDHDNPDHRFVKKLSKRARGQDKSPEPVEESGPPTCIRVGSDCTGYGSDGIALSLLPNVNFSMVFVAEKCPQKRELMRAAHRDQDWSKVRMYHDITKRDNRAAPPVDVFYTGAPCQAWSQAGSRLGLDDLQGRGVVIFHSLDYVRCQRPRVAILENVKGLTHKHNAHILKTILDILQDLGYTVEWKVVSTKDHGIPQSRPRLYIVAIRTRFLAKSITFPKNVQVNPLKNFIDTDDKRPEYERPDAKCFKEAMAKAVEKYGQKKLDETFIVVDTSASEKFSIAMENCVPCITKSRGRLALQRNELIIMACYI